MFFWKIVLAILLLEITWWTYIGTWLWESWTFDRAFDVRFVAGFGGYVFLSFSGIIIYGLITAGIHYPYFTGILLIGIAAMIVFRRFIFTRKTAEVLLETMDIIETKVDSIKEGYCPKIDWE